MVVSPKIDVKKSEAIIHLELFPNETIYYIEEKLGKIYIYKDVVTSVMFNDYTIAYQTLRGRCLISKSNIFFTEDDAYEEAEKKSRRAKIKLIG